MRKIKTFIFILIISIITTKVTVIVFNNVEKLHKELYKIKVKYERKNLSFNHIEKLLEEANNLYLKNGYVTTRVKLKVPQKFLKVGVRREEFFYILGNYTFEVREDNLVLKEENRKNWKVN